jgi:hypothetical protein
MARLCPLHMASSATRTKECSTRDHAAHLAALGAGFVDAVNVEVGAHLPNLLAEGARVKLVHDERLLGAGE